MRVRYNYNYFDLALGGWRAYHLHEVAGVASVPHAKCVGADGSGDPVTHYAAYEVDLWAAHDEFEIQYASERPVTCGGLSPL